MDSVQDLLVDFDEGDDGARDVDSRMDPWKGVDLPIREAGAGVYVEGLSTHIARKAALFA